VTVKNWVFIAWHLTSPFFLKGTLDKILTQGARAHQTCATVFWSVGRRMGSTLWSHISV